MAGAFCMPTALNLTNLIKPRENTYGWIANYEDDQCKTSQVDQVFLDSADCKTIDYKMDTVGINWGTDGGSVNCGLLVYTDEHCVDYAAKYWMPSEGNCRSMGMDGGPWHSVKVNHCWGEGTPGGGTLDDGIPE